MVTLLKDLLIDEDFFNYKSKLLEIIQAKGDEVPKYSVVKEVGPDHNKTFEVEVIIDDKVFGRGRGGSKQAAAKAAARTALKSIKMD